MGKHVAEVAEIDQDHAMILDHLHALIKHVAHYIKDDPDRATVDWVIEVASHLGDPDLYDQELLPAMVASLIVEIARGKRYAIKRGILSRA